MSPISSIFNRQKEKKNYKQNKKNIGKFIYSTVISMPTKALEWMPVVYHWILYFSLQQFLFDRKEKRYLDSKLHWNQVNKPSFSVAAITDSTYYNIAKLMLCGILFPPHTHTYLYSKSLSPVLYIGKKLSSKHFIESAYFQSQSPVINSPKLNYAFPFLKRQLLSPPIPT